MTALIVLPSYSRAKSETAPFSFTRIPLGRSAPSIRTCDQYSIISVKICTAYTCWQLHFYTFLLASIATSTKIIKNDLVDRSHLNVLKYLLLYRFLLSSSSSKRNCSFCFLSFPADTLRQILTRRENPLRKDSTVVQTKPHDNTQSNMLRIQPTVNVLKLHMHTEKKESEREKTTTEFKTSRQNK